jgi:hypothetical protein
MEKVNSRRITSWKTQATNPKKTKIIIDNTAFCFYDYIIT